jgi:hypothetical protein
MVQRAWLWVAGAVTVMAAVARLPLMAANLSVDEVWTLYLLTLVRGPADIIGALRHDNNHLLNSLYLYFAGSTGWVPGYRLLSFASGVATVALIAAIGKRYSRATGITVALACAFSSLLVDLTTQARGYGPAMFFAAAAYFLLDRYLTTGAERERLGFQLAAVLGFLSHLTFLLPYAGYFCWSAVDLRRKRGSVKSLAALHAPILMFLIALYFLSVRGMLVGGGINSRPSQVIGNLVYWSLGVPRNWWWAAVAIAIACVWECYRMYREGRGEWAFFAGASAAALIAVPVWNVAQLTPRYLVVLVPLLFLPLSRFVCRLRWAGAALLLAFLVVQAVHLDQFYRYGRGDYATAAAYLSAHGGTVGTDPSAPAGDFRVDILLWHYGPKIRFVDRAGWRQGAPDWMINCDFRETPARPEPYLDRNGARFEFVRLFRASCTTPLHWLLYRRVP